MSATRHYRFVGEEGAVLPGSFLPLDQLVQLPPEMCRGQLEFVPLRDDMGVHLLDARFEHEVRMDVGHAVPVGLSTLTVVQGHFSVRSPGMREAALCTESASVLVPQPECEGVLRFAANQRVRAVNWDFAPETMEELGLPMREGATSALPLAALRRLAGELLATPYQGALRRYYLESKLLECLVTQAAAMRDAQSHRSSSLRQRDVERMHEARALLLSRLDDPPSLGTLARRVGTNRRKLSADFQQVFGVTVFGCLREARLEQARWLLENSAMSLKEIAPRVGFAHAGNLTRAFVAAFSEPPSRLRDRKG